jgi:hypothetical protein
MVLLWHNKAVEHHLHNKETKMRIVTAFDLGALAAAEGQGGFSKFAAIGPAPMPVLGGGPAAAGAIGPALMPRIGGGPAAAGAMRPAPMPLLGGKRARPKPPEDMFSQFNKAIQDPANAWQPNKFVGPPVELQGSKPNTTIPFRPAGNNPANIYHRDRRLDEIAQRPDPLRQTPVPPRPVDPAVAAIREHHRQAAIPKPLNTQNPANAAAVNRQQQQASALESQNDLSGSLDREAP